MFDRESTCFDSRPFLNYQSKFNLFFNQMPRLLTSLNTKNNTDLWVGVLGM
jgi:hypothetical protein